MDRIRQFLESNNYYDMYENPDLFEKYIQGLTTDDVMNIAISLNQMLRNKENEDVISNNMIAGELTAPTSDVRSVIIENLLDTLKSMSDNKLRAELVYYTLIDLHMFSDGNGRTARLMYGLISGKIEGEEWYMHSDNSMHRYHGDFCSYQGMADESEINHMANQEFSKFVEQYKIQYPLLSNKKIYRTYVSATHGEPMPIDEIMSEDIKNELSDEEKNKIGIILSDNEGYYSIAGLTMLIITAANGQIDEWIRRNEENVENAFESGYGEEWMRSRLSFNLIKNKDLLVKWKIEEWKEVIQIGNRLKCMQFDNLNQIYSNKIIKGNHNKL